MFKLSEIRFFTLFSCLRDPCARIDRKVRGLAHTFFATLRDRIPWLPHFGLKSDRVTAMPPPTQPTGNGPKTTVYIAPNGEGCLVSKKEAKRRRKSDQAEAEETGDENVRTLP